MIEDEELDQALVSKDIVEVLEFYDDLKTENVQRALEDIQRLAKSDNKYAAYVLGSMFLFGKTPRYYIFDKDYEDGEVKRRAKVDIKEEYGFSYWISLLKMNSSEIEEFHLEGLFDLYKIIQGTAQFFKTNDISCRPQSEQDRMYSLFKNEHKLRDFLYRQNHYEVFLDVALDALQRFEESPNRDDMDLALSCFNNILGGEIYCRFTQYQLAHANLGLARIYLHGNEFVEKDVRAAIKYYTASRLDIAYCELIDFYKGYGDQYIASIKKCIGMVRDEELRQRLYAENNIEPVVEVDIIATLKILENTKRKRADINNYSFDDDSGLVVKKPQVIDEDQAYKADQEIANNFPLITDDDEDEMAQLLSDTSGDDSGYSDDDDGFFLEDVVEPDFDGELSDEGLELPYD